MASLAESSYSFIIKLPWVLAVLVVVALLIRGLTEHVTVIEPISVPKALSDNGFTQDVAAKRLRDAMVTYVSKANTRMDQSEMALNTELPNVVVPAVGISLDAIMSTMRTLFRITRTQSVAGELTIGNDQLWLRLRLNNHEFYVAKTGGDPHNPDDVLNSAVPEVLKKIRPYVVAVSIYKKDPDAGLDLVNSIISDLPEYDENVAWAYNLKGILLTSRADPAAEKALLKAVSLGNTRLKATAHNNLGIFYRRQKQFDMAEAQFRMAIKEDPTYAGSYHNLGLVLRDQSHNDKAIAAFREALRLDPRIAQASSSLISAMQAAGQTQEAIAEYTKIVADTPRNLSARIALGNALSAANRTGDAMVHYREAVRIDPNNSTAHFSLGYCLGQIGEREEAITEYRLTIELDPRQSSAHNNIAVLLVQQRKTEEAVAEYQKAIAINPAYERARTNLGVALGSLGRDAEAQVQYEEVLKINPKNPTARDHLNVILSKRKSAEAPPP